VLFRGEVYAWDGTKATGSALFESQQRTTSGLQVQDITFDTGAIPLTPGSQYVLFFSAAKDFEVSAGTGRFRSRTDDTVYPGGKFVFLNNGTDESLWTSSAWSNLPQDLQFRVRFVSPQTLTVTKSGNGTGTVTSSGGVINCGADCSEDYDDGTVVALAADPDPGSTFTGFSGAGCSASPCLVTMDDVKAVAAQFSDNQAPDTTITTGPKPKSPKKKATFAFSASEAGDSFACSLDGGTYAACTSPSTFTVKRGKHTFSVTAIDAAGNIDPTPATYAWKRR
jgi:hypothetical protein